MTNATFSGRFDELDATLRSNWGWFVALGGALVALGVVALANMFVATIASVLYVGVLMTVAGVAQIVHAFRVRTWGSFLLWVLSGLFYGLAGIMMFGNPILASSVLTLVLAASLVVAGALRIGVGIGGRIHQGWGWMVAAGIVTMIAGIVILSGWPVNSLWLLGLFLGFDLVVQGWAAIALGLGFRTMVR